MGINYHYDPDNKRQSMEYRHKGSPAPNKCKTKASAEKLMLTVFWKAEGVVLTDFLENGATVNSERYIETLRTLKNASRGRRQKLMKSCFNETRSGLTQVPPQLMSLHVWGLQCYHIQPTAQISLLAISTCSPN
jgi:hypothetical protein